MAATSIVAVMKGIETNLKTIPNLVTDYIVPDGVTPPIAVVGVPAIPNYHSTFAHGRFAIDPTVTILTSKAFDRTGQEMLAGFADPAGANSIHAAIESDRQLGGACDDCIVTDFRVLHIEEVGSIGYYGGVFTLHVIARGA